MTQATEKPGNYLIRQWDGQTETAEAITAMFNNMGGGDIYSYQVNSDTLAVSEMMSIQTFELGEWAVQGPYWGSAVEGSPVTKYTAAQFADRFDIAP